MNSIRASILLLACCLLLDNAEPKCTLTFIATCEKVSDVPRYAETSWRNLIIAKDQCRTTSEGPNEVLKSDAFLATPNLEEIYISETLINIEPRAFNGLEQLTYLKLHKNVLKVIPKGAFSNLPQMFKLDLQENFIENIEHGLFENSSFVTINLSYNKMNNIQVGKLDFPNLMRLIMTNNDVSYIAPKSFHKNLEYLNLDHNSLVEIDENVLAQLSNLKELILSNNGLKFITSSLRLPSLEKLDLSYNDIKGIESGAFHDFPELTHLLLGHNDITYLSPDVFPIGNVITTLHLHHNSLLYLDTNVGDKLKRLKELSIGGNPWTCACLRKIADFVSAKNIVQPECDKKYYSGGDAAICSVIGDGCTGGEKLSKELLDKFKQSLQHVFCEK